MRGFLIRWSMVAACVAGLALSAPAKADAPVGTAFTYQGSLFDNGQAVSNDCDFEFRLFDDPV
ncbi:MAG: hypothetical protein D6744_12150, partial [Planctomycetota bacterium]